MDTVSQKHSFPKVGLLLLGFIALAIANGSRQSYGVFLPALVKELGASNAKLSAAFSIIHLVNGSLAPFVGRSIDIYPPRPIFLLGTFLVTLAFALLGFIKELWHIYILVALLLAPGISCIGLTAVNTMITRYFVAGRGTALGFVAMGSGVGTFLYLFFSSILISRLGWRETFWFWGGLQLLILLPLVLKVLTIPKEDEPKGSHINQNQRNRTSIPWRSRNFILIYLLVILFTMANFIFLMYTVLFAQSKGLTYVYAAQAFSLVGISNALGSMILGSLSDLFRHRIMSLVLAIGLVIAALVLILALPTNYPLLIVSSILFGLGMGGYYPILPVLVGELFDHNQIGSIYGATLLAGGIGAFVGPVVGGRVYDLTTSYSFTMGIALVFALLAISIALLLVMKNVHKKEDYHDYVNKGSCRKPA